MEQRTCSMCREQKALEEFCKDKRRPEGRGYSCKPCTSARTQRYASYKRAQARRDPAKKYRWYDRSCETCGEVWKTRNRRGRFCSLACRDHEARQRRMPVPYGELAYSDLPARHPARQPAPRRTDWWKLFVTGACPWCRDPFTAATSCWSTRSRHCSKRCANSAAWASRGGRFRIAPVVRASIYDRDGWVCQLCEDPVDPDLWTSDPWAATLDHIVPQSWTLIPDDRPENLRLAHRWCNSVRGDEAHYTEEVLRRAF